MLRIYTIKYKKITITSIIQVIWKDILTKQHNKHNLKLFCEYAFSINTNNAFIERTVHLCNNILCQERKSLSILILDCILQICINGPRLGFNDEFIRRIVDCHINIGGFQATKSSEAASDIVNCIKYAMRYQCGLRLDFTKADKSSYDNTKLLEEPDNEYKISKYEKALEHLFLKTNINNQLVSDPLKMYFDKKNEEKKEDDDDDFDI